MSGKPPPDEVLSIEDLHITVHDGAATALRGITLSVGAGEIVGLVGESGSGKTLTCRAALGVLPPGCAVSRGTISFGGEDVTDLSRRGWERLHGTAVGAVFQDPASYLNPNLTVGGQLAEVLRVKQGWRGPRRTADGRAVRRRRPAQSGAGLPPDPGRAVRRHAAAGDDRDRHLLRPAAAHRRRGHHRPRRHHPGRDHRAAQGPARPARPGRALRLPRPRADQGAVRPGRGLLRGRGGRDRPGRGDHRPAPAPLHPGAAPGRLGRRLPAPRAAGDPRPAAAGGRGRSPAAGSPRAARPPSTPAGPARST